MPNKKELIKLAVWIGGEKAKQDIGVPSEWDQGLWFDEHGITLNGDATWACGTSCCAAGHVGIEAGGLPVFHVYVESYGDGDNGVFDMRWIDMGPRERKALTSSSSLVEDDLGIVEVYVSDMKMAFPVGDGTYKVDSVRSYAANVLGLNDVQASMLFGATNGYDSMMSLIHAFIAEEERN